MERLLDEGANVEYCGKDVRTPLILACISGHECVVVRLIQRKADTIVKDTHHQTQIHHPSQKGHALVVKVVLSHGLAVNARDTNGLSSLDLAVRQKAGPFAHPLLFYGAEDLDGQARGQSHIACGRGSEAGVQDMINRNRI